MTAKDYLKDIRTQEFRLRSIEEAILVLETKATKVTSTWSDMPGGGVNDGIAGIVLKLVETRQKYIAQWDRLIDDRNEAMKMLAKLKKNYHYDVLWLYYIRCKNWIEVSEAMHISESYAFMLHGQALAELQLIMQDSSK